MWTKIQFDKDTEKSSLGNTVGDVTAVWNESQGDEFIYEEYITIETDSVGFCQRANNARIANVTKVSIEQTAIVDQEVMAHQLLKQINL